MVTFGFADGFCQNVGIETTSPGSPTEIFSSSYYTGERSHLAIANPGIDFDFFLNRRKMSRIYTINTNVENLAPSSFYTNRSVITLPI